MASGDTKTNQYLDVAANGTRADLPSDTCCETRSQTLIREVAERIMDVEDEVERLENNPDVVDIVDTYEDLEDYDTSTLTDKDIIRVLNDETHDGESTYYRYDKQSNTFTYIGSAGGSGGSGIPTDATFWGQSYDSVNNKVDGAMIITNPASGSQYYVTYKNGNNSRFIMVDPASGEWNFDVGGSNQGYVTFKSDLIEVSSSNNTRYMRRISRVKDPANAQDAATKNYVDSIYPVGAVFPSTSATAPTIAGGTWTEIGTQTVGSSTVHYYERTA